MITPVSPEDEETIVRLYTTGTPVMELTIMYRKHHMSIKKILEKHGVRQDRRNCRRPQAPATKFSDYEAVVVFGDEPPPAGMLPIENPYLAEGARLYAKL